jgi:hypothetical protein
VKLRPAVREALAAHGIEALEDDDPRPLRDRLNETYLVEVRRLKDRQRAGEIPLPEYAAHVEALKRRFALLGLPARFWTE